MANVAASARICLIGPESTGKTELAEALARSLGLPWVPEYAREYAEAHPRELTAADVEPIARGQLALEDAVPPPAVLDTDLISTVVYARYYYGECPAWIERAARDRRADLYLLCDTDIPWRADRARSGGSADEREEQFDAFRRALDEFEVRWTIVSGEWEERLAAAVESCKAVKLESGGSNDTLPP